MSEHSGSGDIERTIGLLWGAGPGPGRGPRRSLSVPEIVAAAVAIADESGLEAVSIRAVAARVGVAAMSLYRYIPSKAELIDLMLDHISRPNPERLPADWRPAMEVLAREMWDLHTTHRWLPSVDRSRPVLGPNAVSALDRAMGALAPSELTDPEKIALTVTVESFVSSLARTANAIAAAAEQTGMSHEAFWQLQEPALITAMETGRYPHVANLAEDSFAAPIEDTFEFGLAAILDGVQALLDRRREHRKSTGRNRAHS